MDLGLNNKVALVTGASSGLGRAVAEELAAEGAWVALVARREALLAEVVAGIVARGGRALAVAADLSEPGAAAAAVARCEAALGAVDILVTNGGGPPSLSFEQTTPAQWQAALAMNLHSALELCRAVLPGMRQKRWGRILTITSITVKQPVENLVLSNAVRAAVTGFARTLANEVAAEGITVNNLAPGYTQTERLDELATAVGARRQLSPAAAKAGWEAQIPMGRLGEAAEFAALAAFLASARASYITGQTIAVDGGWTRSIF
ncbi:short-chain dehydrogenase [Paucibacter sp. KBW04]|uniref:SDR family oxidoreductase n=1 Tax=Paucibacter sp. KBW04 TaxID=2153361 RepID=UPI000F569F60|nr:SDR family oxidoreductase [Paucibacter sp. KBW04]RQO59712.1 short-chain dehydrogenase [Paucibacter sp. KBW04]